uniref:Uncharacterized protein n=1 Tax=Anguilla anguilla TaxID=7936 RepID=A0A0E9XI57_ANGAN
MASIYLPFNSIIESCPMRYRSGKIRGNLSRRSLKASLPTFISVVLKDVGMQFQKSCHNVTSNPVS